MDNINVEVKLQKQIGDVKIVMLKGDDGASIASIDKTSTEGLVDTYTITLTDGRHTTFQVTNGSSIATIEKTASIGHTDIYTITLTDGSTSTFEVTNGDNWIDNDEKTATDFFETINGGLLSSCKVALSPNQDLHGYDEPWVGGAGKNKLPLVLADIKSANTAGTWSDNVYTINGGTITIDTDVDGNVIDIKANGTFTERTVLFIVRTTNNYHPTSGSYIVNKSYQNTYTTINVDGYNNNTWVQSLAKSSSVDDVQFTLDYSGYDRLSIYLEISSGVSANNIIFKPMLRLATETDPTFEPYSNICPISGHTQVDVGDDGKNLIGLGTRLDGYTRVENYFVTNSSSVGYYFKTSDLPDVVTVSDVGGNRAYVSYFNEVPADNVVCISKDQSQQTVPKTFTVDKTAEYVHIQLSYGTTDVTNIQIEEGSTATAYVPYNGYQVTVNLGGTYYSGTLDVVSGVLTVDKASVEYDGSNDENITVVESDKCRCMIECPSDSIVNTDGTKFCGLISNEFEEQTNNGTYSGRVGFHIRANGTHQIVFALGFDSGLNNAEKWRTWLSNNPVMVVYPLANPTPIQLSPTMVKALVGENHLSAPLEGQEIDEVKYRYVFTWDDVNGITDKLSDRLDDVEEILAETSYTSAVACLVDDTTCTITDSNIKTTSLIEVFSSNSSGDTTVVTNIAVTNGQAVLTFDALVEATSFKLRITNL